MKRSAEEVVEVSSPAKKARTEGEQSLPPPPQQRPPVPSSARPWRFLTCGEDGASYSGYKWQPPNDEMAAVMHEAFWTCQQRAARHGELLWFRDLLQWLVGGDQADLLDDDTRGMVALIYGCDRDEAGTLTALTEAEIIFHDGPTYIYEDWC